MGSGQRRLSRGDVFVLACCAVAVTLSVYRSRGIWGEGIPVGVDMGAHFVRADQALGYFFPQGRLDGWQSRFGLGYQQSLFMGPGFDVLVGLVKVAGWGYLSTTAAVKLAIVVTHAALPLAVAALAWALGFGRRAIGVAALLSLGVTVALGGVGLAPLLGFALVPNSLGAVFALLAAAGIVRVARQPSVPGIVFAAVFLAAVIMTHPWSAMALMIFVALFVPLAVLDRARTHPRPIVALVPAPDEPAPSDPGAPRRIAVREGLLRMGAVGLVVVAGGALAGMQVLPALAHRDLKVTNASFPDAPLGRRLLDAWQGTDYLRPGLALLVVAGLVWTAVLAWRGRPGALPLVLTPIVWIVAARAARTLLPNRTVAVQVTNRSMFFITVLVVLGAALVIAELGTHLAAWGRRWRARGRTVPPWPAGAGSAALLALILVALVTLSPAPQEDTAATVTPEPALAHAAAELGRRVPDTGRYLVQRSAPDGGRENLWPPYLWIAWASGRNSLNVYNIESSAVDKPVYEGDDLDEVPPAEEADVLQRYGVTHVLLFEPHRVPDLLAHPRFPTVWQEDGLVIVEVRSADGQPSPVPVVSATTPTGGSVRRAEPEHLAFELAPGPARTATLAVAHSPKWTARVNGEPVALGRDAENLLTVDLPPGPVVLELDFGPDLADRLGLALTLLAAGAVVVALHRNIRARARAAEPERTGDDPRTGNDTWRPAA